MSGRSKAASGTESGRHALPAYLRLPLSEQVEWVLAEVLAAQAKGHMVDLVGVAWDLAEVLAGSAGRAEVSAAVWGREVVLVAAERAPALEVSAAWDPEAVGVTADPAVVLAAALAANPVRESSRFITISRYVATTASRQPKSALRHRSTGHMELLTIGDRAKLASSCL